MHLFKNLTATIILGFIVAAGLALLVGEVSFNRFGLMIGLHALIAFVWIGMLYYMNFVQMPVMNNLSRQLSEPQVTLVEKVITPRTFLWFRWAALLTWLSGLIVFKIIGFDLLSVFTLQEGREIFGAGAWIGTIMMLNVWLIMWPAQKKLLSMENLSDAEKESARNLLLIASRTNVILSIPVIMFMIGQSHGIPL